MDLMYIFDKNKGLGFEDVVLLGCTYTSYLKKLEYKIINQIDTKVNEKMKSEH